MSSTVLGTVMVIRSGDRLYEPQFAYQVKPVPGTGVLTPLGEQQELQLGNLLRSIYLDPTSSSFIQGFTGTSLYNASEVAIDADGAPSSGAPFDSAVALAQGLWPPTGADSIQLANGSTITSPFGGYQYVEVEAVSPTDSPALNGAFLCTGFWTRLAQILVPEPSTEEGAQVTQLLSQLKQFVPPDYANVSTDVAQATALYYLSDVFDYMNVQSIHNASYLASLPSASLERMHSLNDWLAHSLFTDPSPGGIGNIAGISIMSSILDALSDIQNPTNGLKMAINVVTYQPFLSDRENLGNRRALLELSEATTVGVANGTRAAEYERLSTFFTILASGDRSRYGIASTMLKPRQERAYVPDTEHVDAPLAQDVCSTRHAKEFFDEAGLELMHGPAPTFDTMSEFTFKMSIQDVYGAKRWQEVVAELLRASQETFRPLAEVQARQAIARAAAAALAERGSLKGGLEGSLRLKRPTKKRCVGRDKRAGADADTREWFYETTDASNEYLAAANLRARKVAGSAPESPVDTVAGSQPVTPISPTWEPHAGGARERCWTTMSSSRRENVDLQSSKPAKRNRNSRVRSISSVPWWRPG